MKKKVLLGAFAALCLGVGITAAVKASQMSKQASAMMLANAEALALGEMIGNEYCDTGYHGTICATVYDAKGQSFTLYHYIP